MSYNRYEYKTILLMKRPLIFIALGVVEIIILTLLGLFFYH